MSIWQEVPDNEEGIICETRIANVIHTTQDDNFDRPVVLLCCDNPDLWFQQVELSPISGGCRVICKSCKREGEISGWSDPMGIALWNIALWNPEYMGRDPLKVADKIEGISLEEVTLKDLEQVLSVLKEAPTFLRILVDEVEEAKVERYMKKLEEEE